MPLPYIASTAEDDASGGSNLFIPNPTGVVVGDLLVAFVTADATGGWASEAGWTEVYDTATAGERMACYWKIAGEADTTASSHQFSSPGGESAGLIHRVVGAHGSSPINASSTPAVDTASPYDANAVSSTIDDCLAIAAVGLDGLNSTGAMTFSWSDGFSAHTVARQDSEEMHTATAAKAVPTAGLIDTTATPSGSTGSQPAVVAIIVIAPASVAASDRLRPGVDLLERDGDLLTTLNPHTGTLVQRLNTYATLTISVRHSAENDNQLDLIEIGKVLRLRIGGALRFAGPIYAITEEGDASGFDVVTVKAADPFFVLHHRYTTNASPLYAATDAGAIANDLIGLANFDVGGDTDPTYNTLLDDGGDVDTSVNRDRDYQRQVHKYGELIENLANVENGFYFVVVPIDTGSTVETYRCGELDIRYPNPGVSSGARFEYGPGTLANLERFRVETGKPHQLGIFHGTGAGEVESPTGVLGSTWDDAVDAYGLWQRQASDPEVSEPDTITQRARDLASLEPIKTYGFTVSRGADNVPVPWDDFGIGDSVDVYAVLPLTTVDTSLTVTEITTSFDENSLYLAGVVVEEL